MADEIKFEIKGINELLAKLDAAKREDVITKSLWQGGKYLQRWIRNNRLTGPRPFFLAPGIHPPGYGRGSGRLRASITISKPTKEGDDYITRIGTNLIYARIHEYGGIIRAKNKPFLCFQVPTGSVIFSKRGGMLKRPRTMWQWVRVKEVTIPARPFIRPAIEERENREMVVNTLIENISQAMEKAK